MYVRSKLKTKEGVADLSDGANKVSSDVGKANLHSKFLAVFLQMKILQTSHQARRDIGSKLSEIFISRDDVSKRLVALNQS